MARKHRPQQRSPLPRALFFDEKADRIRSCESKDAHPSYEVARAHALSNGMGDVLNAYECTYCGQWHLTRRREQAGR